MTRRSSTPKATPAQNSAAEVKPKLVRRATVKAKSPTKAAQVRALLDNGLTKAAIAKKTGIPYPYVWDIEAAWKRAKAVSK